MNKNILDMCLVKKGTFKPLSLGGDIEVTIRELTISETQEFMRKREEETQQEAINYAVSCSMIEPTFFTPEQLKELNSVGFSLINEIFSEIAVIGKTKKERTEYFEKLEKLIKEKAESTEKEEDVDLEKK